MRLMEKQAHRERPILFSGEMVRAILDGRNSCGYFIGKYDTMPAWETLIGVIQIGRIYWAWFTAMGALRLVRLILPWAIRTLNTLTLLLLYGVGLDMSRRFTGRDLRSNSAFIAQPWQGYFANSSPKGYGHYQSISVSATGWPACLTLMDAYPLPQRNAPWLSRSSVAAICNWWLMPLSRSARRDPQFTTELVNLMARITKSKSYVLQALPTYLPFQKRFTFAIPGRSSVSLKPFLT